MPKCCIDYVLLILQKAEVAELRQEFNSGFIFLNSISQRADEIAIQDEASVFTYKHLAHASIFAALHMRRLGVKQGDTVAVKTSDLLALMATVFGTALLGCRWVYASKNLIETKVIEPTIILEDDDGNTEFGGSHAIGEHWARPPDGDDLSHLPEFSGYASPEDVWMISSTSGTTGTPKLVGLSHKIVFNRCVANRDPFKGSQRKISGLFPIGAPVQVARYLATMINGGQIVSSVDPQFWLKHSVDHVFGSPAQARLLLRDVILHPKLPRFHLSGSTASENLIRHLLKSFEVVANGYGSTEAHNCLIIEKSIADDNSLKNKTVLRDTTIELVDHEDKEVKDGDEGIVRLKGPRVVSNYLDNIQANKAFFKDGYFYPGDIARWTADGTFFVTGRVNDLFNLGGVKLNAGLMDYTLQNVNGVEDAVCFLVPDDLGENSLRVFLSLDGDSSKTSILNEAKIALLKLGGVDAVPEKFLFLDKIPRNPNGKPDRAACAALILDKKQQKK